MKRNNSSPGAPSRCARPSANSGRALRLQFFTLCPQAQLGIRDALADAQRLWRHLKELIGPNVLQRQLQGQFARRDEHDRGFACGGAHVRQLLLLADVQLDVSITAGLSHHHALVDRHAGSNEEFAALLRGFGDVKVGDRVTFHLPMVPELPVSMLACARLIKTGRAAPLPRTLKMRLNTNGLANAVWGRNVVPEMKGLIDSVHVSLNTADPAQWLALMRPLEPWGATGFEKVKEFIREAVMLLPEVYATAVADKDLDQEKFKALAGQLGAEPRLRPKLEAPGD